MPRIAEAPRPEHKTVDQLVSELQARLTDIDVEVDNLKTERFRVNAALLALQGRKPVGRPRVAA